MRSRAPGRGAAVVGKVRSRRTPVVGTSRRVLRCRRAHLFLRSVRMTTSTAGRARAWGGWMGLALLAMLFVAPAEAAPKGSGRAKPTKDEPPAGTIELPEATPVKLPAAVDAVVPGG